VWVGFGNTYNYLHWTLPSNWLSNYDASAKTGRYPLLVYFIRTSTDYSVTTIPARRLKFLKYGPPYTDCMECQHSFHSTPTGNVDIDCLPLSDKRFNSQNLFYRLDTALSTQYVEPVEHIWSRWRDSNSRPIAPKAIALPGCATPS
jgi:hypothetical protein